MATPSITLYVDVVSPFAYEAYYLLRNDPLFTPLPVTYIPIFLGGLMHKCANTPPMRIANKGKWINTERLRWAKQFNIPIVESLPGRPGEFPANTLSAMRVLAALHAEEGGKEGQGRMIKLLDALFEAYWARGERVYDAEVLGKVVGGVFGEEEGKRCESCSLHFSCFWESLALEILLLPWCLDPWYGKVMLTQLQCLRRPRR